MNQLMQAISLKVRGFSGPFYNSNNFFTLSMPALESTCWPSHPLLLVLFIALIKRIRVADWQVVLINSSDCLIYFNVRGTS